jgi:competence protein ComEC
MTSGPESNTVRPPLGPRYQPLVIVLAAAALGIGVDRFVPLPVWAWWALAVGGLAAWFLIPTSRRVAAVAGGVFLLLAVTAVGGAWHHCRWNLFAADELGRYAPHKAQPVCFEAVAVEAPRAMPAEAPDPMRVLESGEQSRLAVDVVALRNGAAWQPVSGRALLQVSGRPRIEAGDRLRCFGQFWAPAGPQNPGAADRAARLRADRVRTCIACEVPECISLVATGRPWNLWRQLGRLRAHGNEVLKQHLDPKQGELVAAVLLGFREDLDSDRVERFVTTGTVHFLAISGLHVGVLAVALFWILRRTSVPRGWTAAAVAGFTVLYALLVDVGPPVVRATILVLIGCAAVWLGRRPLGFNSLAAAALVVLAMNPAHLFHVGAQLSFLCVAGLIWFESRRQHGGDEPDSATRTLQRLVNQNLSWPSRAMRYVGRAAVGLPLAGLVLWALSSPLVMARFHVFSPVALVANVLLWIPMSVSLVSGFCVLVFGAIWSPLGSLCGWACNASFWFLEWCISLGDGLRCGHFWVPGPADWWLWGYYTALGLAVALPRFRPPRRWQVALLAGWIAVGFVASAARHDRHRLDCTFLSMGHGTAVFVEFPSGKTLLYDAGHMGPPEAGVSAICEFLWDRGLRHVDAVVLSHADLDHYNALPGVLRKFSVGAVYVSPRMFEKENSPMTALRKAIDDRGVPLREIYAGDRLRVGDGCCVEVLYPSKDDISNPDNTNAHSLVLSLEQDGRRILLPGDLESPGLDEMLTEEPRRCEVLMAPHHGSRRSNSPALAAWCRPRWVVYSGDGRWSVPEAEAPYHNVGAETLYTFDGGAVRVQVGTDGVRVSQFAKRD